MRPALFFCHQHVPPPASGRWSRHRRCLALLSLLVACPGGAAADRVVMLPDQQGEAKEWVGTIDDMKGTNLSITVGARARTLPAWEVDRVETEWQPSHSRGKRLARRGEFEQAMQAYRDAYQEESRRWCKRILLRETAQILLELQQIEQAATLALTLFREDPQSTHVAAIPLKWDARPIPRSVERQASEWLGTVDQPAAQLLGASWLLGSPRRTDAINMLQSLTDNANPGIAQLAHTQLWRVEAVAISAQQLERWRIFTQRIHPSLRAGPYYVMATAAERLAEDPRSAAIDFLRVTTLFPEQAHLAAEASLRAGYLLDKLGDKKQAGLVYEQLLQSYPTSAAAQELQAASR